MTPTLQQIFKAIDNIEIAVSQEASLKQALKDKISLAWSSQPDWIKEWTFNNIQDRGSECLITNLQSEVL